MRSYLAGLYLFGLSLAAWPGFGDSVREPQWIWAVTGGAILAALTPLETIRAAARIPDFSFLLLLCYFVAHAAAGENFVHSITSIIAPVLIAAGALAVWVNEPPLGAVAVRRVLLAVTVLQLAEGALQVAGWDPLFSRRDVPGLEAGLPGGFCGHHTLYGLLMAVLAFFWLREGRRFLSAVCVVALFLTKSAFALAALFYGLVWFAYCRGWRKSSVSAGTGAVIVGAFLFLRSEAPGDFFFHNGRLQVWIYAVRAIREKVWLGYGINAFSSDFPRFFQVIDGPRWTEAHNELIEYVFNVGLLGLFAALPLILQIAKKLWTQPQSAGRDLAVGMLFMVGVNAMGSFPLQIAPFATIVIYAVVWALSLPSGINGESPGPIGS